MEMILVSSSNLYAVGYDGCNLYVRFNNGSLYEYFNVPQSVYRGLLNAPSKGSYLHHFVKGVYRYQKL